MKTRLLLAALAGFALVSAAPPGDPIPWEDEASLKDYPSCSRTVTDRCIQRGGRDDAAPNADAVRDVDYAATAPAAGRGDYPPCSATVTDRCIQSGGRSHQAVTRMARSAPKARHHQRRMQLAMRAGERG